MAIAQEDGVSAYGVLMYVDFIFKAFFFGYSSPSRRSSATTTAHKTMRSSKASCARA